MGIIAITQKCGYLGTNRWETSVQTGSSSYCCCGIEWLLRMRHCCSKRMLRSAEPAAELRRNSMLSGGTNWSNMATVPNLGNAVSSVSPIPFQVRTYQQ